MQRGEYSIVDNNSISINAVREQRVEALCHAHRLSISRVIPSALRVGRAPILLRDGCSCRNGRIGSVIISEQTRQRNKRRRNVKVVGIGG